MASVTISYHGTKTYRDNNERMHREDGPALIEKTGYKCWYLNGVAHKSISRNGLVRYANNSRVYSFNPNGRMEQFDNLVRSAWPKL